MEILRCLVAVNT